MTGAPTERIELLQFTGAVLDAQRASLRPLLEEEARLLSAKDEILSIPADVNDARLHHRVGADVAWERWSSAKVRDIDMHLARNRALILQRREAVRQAQARHDAMSELCREERAAAQRQGVRRREDAMFGMFLLRAGAGCRVKDRDGRCP